MSGVSGRFVVRTVAVTTKLGCFARNLGAGCRYILPSSLIGGKNLFSPTTDKQVHGLDSWRKSRVYLCRELVFCCLKGARPYFQPWSAVRYGYSPVLSGWHEDRENNPQVREATREFPSILETAERATYSSLRRKKTHSLPGDSAITPGAESGQLCDAVPRKCKDACRLASSPITQALNTTKGVLRGSAPRTPKSKPGKRRG